MLFQNDWQILHRRSQSEGDFISKSHTFDCDIKYSSDMLSIYILISLKLLITAVITHAICLKDYRIISFLSIQYVQGDLCKHLGIDSSTDVRYSNLFLNAHINRHVHAKYLKMI